MNTNGWGDSIEIFETAIETKAYLWTKNQEYLVGFFCLCKPRNK